MRLDYLQNLVYKPWTTKAVDDLTCTKLASSFLSTRALFASFNHDVDITDVIILEMLSVLIKYKNIARSLRRVKACKQLLILFFIDQAVLCRWAVQ